MTGSSRLVWRVRIGGWYEDVEAPCAPLALYFASSRYYQMHAVSGQPAMTRLEAAVEFLHARGRGSTNRAGERRVERNGRYRYGMKTGS